MQNILRENLDWDEKDQIEWKNYNQQLSEIESLSIPRWIDSNYKKQIKQHGTADASTKAYGACIHCIYIHSHNN